MGELADYTLEQFDYGRDDMGPSEPEDYLHLTDEELKKETKQARTEKIKGISNFEKKLSDKQRFCLAAWLADRDNKQVK